MKKAFGISLVLIIFLSALHGSVQSFGFILQSRWSVPAGPVRALAFSPDGSWFLVSAANRALVFEVGSGDRPSERDSVTVRKEIQGAAVSPDGQTIALVDAGGTLSLYGSQRLEPIAIVSKAHSGKALAVTFTADGAYVVTGGQDGKIKVWTPRGELFADLSRGIRHESEVVMVAATPPGRRIISVGKDRQILLWDIDTQQVLRPTKVESDVLSAAVGGDGRTLVLGLQLLTGNRFRSAPMESLAHAIDADDRVRLINLESGTQIRDIQGERQDLEAVGVTPDGRFVAAAGGGSDASVWDSATGNRITSIPFTEPVTALTFAPDGKWMLAGTRTGSLSLFKLSGVGAGARPTLVQPILILILEPSGLVDENEEDRGQIPRVSTPSLRIQGRIKTSTSIRSLLVDGQEITSLLPDESGGYLFTAYVPLPQPGRRRIEIVTENEHGASARKIFVVERAPAAPAVQSTQVGQGRRIALIVGVSRYANPSINLQYAGADAKALSELLTDPALGPAAFRENDIRLLLDEQATVANINKGLREFLQQARENDFVLFYFAGHGAPDPNRLQDLYLLAHDTDPENIAGTGILMRHVREAIQQIPARDVLILTDSCHSAGISAPASMRSLGANPIHKVFLDRMLHASGGLAILTASEAAQVSYENAKWGKHGVFTYFLLHGLKGAADVDRDRIVTLGELMEYVRDHVRQATESKQIPAIGPTSFDRQLPLVVITQEN